MFSGCEYTWCVDVVHVYVKNEYATSKDPREDSIKTIIVNPKIESYIKTYKGNFYGYGNKNFFRRTYNMSINGEFIRPNDIIGNDDFIFLTVVTGKKCVKEQLDKYILPMSEESNYEFIEDIKSVNANTNVIALFVEFDDEGNKNKFPLRLLNIENKKTQVIEISLQSECGSEQIESVKLLEKKIIIEYLSESNKSKIFETLINI